MQTIQMRHATLSGKTSFSIANGKIYPIQDGCIAVEPVDVPAALQSGFVILAGQEHLWPALQLITLKVPKGCADGNLVAPDGSKIVVANGICQVPRHLENHYGQMGFLRQ